MQIPVYPHISRDNTRKRLIATYGEIIILRYLSEKAKQISLHQNQIFYVMKKTLVVYGSSTGTCQDLAERIAKKLGLPSDCVVDVAKLTNTQIADAEALLLGSSTWGDGELQDDWYDGLKTLKSAGLDGKTVALFGCGDSASYPDTFSSAIGEIYKEIADSGCTITGKVATEGYTFDGSEAVIDGEFVGLPLDEINESDMTDQRIDTWLDSIKGKLA